MRDYYTRHDVEAAANAAILAADGKLARAVALQISRAVLSGFGLKYRVEGYRPGESCPECGNISWIVGRQSAECASCEHVLPLAHA